MTTQTPTPRARRRPVLYGFGLLTLLLALLWFNNARAEVDYYGPRALTNAELQLTIKRAGLGINASQGNNRAQLWVNSRDGAGTLISGRRARKEMLKAGTAQLDESGNAIRATVQIRAGGGDDLILLGHRVYRIGSYSPTELASWGCSQTVGEGNDPACLIVEVMEVNQGAIANGGSGADTIIGSTKDDVMYTGNTPRGRNDILRGEGGDDVLVSNSRIAGGFAMMYGGPGDDLFITKGRATSHMFGEHGSNTYVLGDGPDHVHVRMGGSTHERDADTIFFFDPDEDTWSRTPEIVYSQNHRTVPFDTALLPSVELLGRTFTLDADTINENMVRFVYDESDNLTGCNCSRVVNWVWGADQEVPGLPAPEWYTPTEE